MKSQDLATIVANSNGKFVKVTFTKKDGSLRVMVCRLGVTKHLKGGESTLDADKYLTVFDVQAQGYRAINKDAIQSVVFAGEEYAV